MTVGGPTEVRGFLRACHHQYLFDRELQEWVCFSCGKSLGLVNSALNHRCEPDCEIHEEVSGLG